MKDILSLCHLVSIGVASLILLARAITLFKHTQENSPQMKGRKVWVALQHLAMTAVIITGCLLLNAQGFNIDTWFYAKAILFVVVLSSLSKAYTKAQDVLLVQRRGGWVIAMIAWGSIFALSWTQPSLS